MLEQDKRRVEYYWKRSLLEELNKKGLVKPTAEDLLDHLLGSQDYRGESDYTLYKYTYPTSRTFMQRVNILWVYPLVLITIPIQWVVRGKVGLTTTSRIGRIVDYLVKFEK